MYLQLALSALMLISGGDCSEKVVGGYEPRPHSAPYMAHLDGPSMFCTGTLIHELWVLSAAHCYFRPEAFTVVLGDHDLYKDEGTEQIFQPVLAIQHPQWNPTIDDNDVMMIKLERPAIINNYVQLATLPNDDAAEGSQCTACGWGYTDYIGTTLPDRLHCVEVDIVSNEKCNQVYNGEVLESMLCAGGDGKDSCNGDSGGPLTCDNELQGVTSFGYGCAYPTFPGIYARVTWYTSWIDITIMYN